MKIAIDMQGAQSKGSRNRGIGRYTQALVRSVVLNKASDEEVVLIFSSAYIGVIPDILKEMDLPLGEFEYVIWHTPSSVSALAGDSTLREATELLREAFICSLEPDVLLITSLFEGFAEDVVTSVHKGTGRIPTAVILYDLIPYLHRSVYLSDSRVEAWYEAKVHELRRADRLFAISEASRVDAMDVLGLPPSFVFNISSSVDGFHQTAMVDATYFEKFGISGKYILYTGGIDHRKNIEGLIEAYSLLPKAISHEHQLVIVCSVEEIAKERLLKLARHFNVPQGRIVFTGFVNESDLVGLYSTCELFVFPSLYEGFGLPVLEAMLCGCVVIGSATSSIPEVIGFPDALFDPADHQAIAHKIEYGLTNLEFRQKFREHATEQVKLFSWTRSAERVLAGLREIAGKRYAPEALASSIRPRLAYVSPLPPTQSGIADYSAELLPDLAKHYDIDVVVADPNVELAWVRGASRVLTVESFRSKSSSYDRVLYHFGNSEFHKHMFDLIEEIPGVAVIHDFFLSGVHNFLETYGLRNNSFKQSIFASHGYGGLLYYRDQGIHNAIMNLPCNLPVLSAAIGVISHSSFSKSLAHKYYGAAFDGAWAVAPHARVLPTKNGRSAIRKKLGIADNEILICSFGIIAETKLNMRLLHAWKALCGETGFKLKLVFVGGNSGNSYGMELESAIRDASIIGDAKITGWASQELYRDYLLAADIAVQLRSSSRGETSGTVLDCMAWGVPTVINQNGSMAEFDSQAVVKLSDEFSDTDLIAALRRLVESPEERRRIGGQARTHVKEVYCPYKAAGIYRAAIEEFYLSKGAIPTRLVRNLQSRFTWSNAQDLVCFSDAMAKNFSGRRLQSMLCYWPSELSSVDEKLVLSLISRSVPGLRLDACYEAEGGILRYAREKCFSRLKLPQIGLADDLVDLCGGDVIYVPESVDISDTSLPQIAISFPGVKLRSLKWLASDLEEWTVYP